MMKIHNIKVYQHNDILILEVRCKDSLSDEVRGRGFSVFIGEDAEILGGELVRMGEGILRECHQSTGKENENGLS